MFHFLIPQLSFCPFLVVLVYVIRDSKSTIVFSYVHQVLLLSKSGERELIVIARQHLQHNCLADSHFWWLCCWWPGSPVRHTSGAICGSSRHNVAVRDNISCFPVVCLPFKGQGDAEHCVHRLPTSVQPFCCKYAYVGKTDHGCHDQDKCTMRKGDH